MAEVFKTSQTQLLELVGVELYGYCNGYFGRDSYSDKVIEAAGKDWIVVRESNGTPNMATFESTKEMFRYIEEWSREPNIEDY